MDANQRLDYFRSEVFGQVAQVRKEVAERERITSERIAALEQTVQKQARLIKDLEVSVR